MLHVIHQSGTQKLAIENYFVEETKEEGQDKSVFTIVTLLPETGPIALAQYDSSSDAVKVFSQMVNCEFLGLLCFLPLDDPEEIKNFITLPSGVDTNKIPFLFDTKKEGGKK